MADHYDQLQRLLSTEAAAYGCAVEIQLRRGLNVVGISIWRVSGGGQHAIQIDWMADLDGLSTSEALAVAEQRLGDQGR